VSSSKDKQIRA
jgi:hypothetical protein